MILNHILTFSSLNSRSLAVIFDENEPSKHIPSEDMLLGLIDSFLRRGLYLDEKNFFT